ncbi:carbohydrate kinase family protein [Eudoraea sp.]|uniref:carbohydrate kinase family protein n=1 Tax=Eudoraea sp. TaxID=1979955 RepID=UPI003C78A632
MKEVFCIGELLIDFVAEKQGNNLSEAKEFTKKAGGAPANVACAIARLGGKSSFMGCVGNDPFGNFLLNVLEEEGVNISLAQRSEEFTTLAFVSIDEDGERDFVFSRGADKEFKYSPSIKNMFYNNMVHFGAATALLGGNLEEAYGRFLFDAITHDAFVSFDPNYRADLWKNKEDIFIKKCMPFIEKSTLCKFSLEEAKLLSNKEDILDACAFFHEMGTKVVTVTMGAEGTLLSSHKKAEIVPSIPVKAVDTTGAGDAFIGCFLQQISGLKETNELIADFDLLVKMVAKANKAGAITTQNYGAIRSLPTQDQLNT